jgi:T-complex protein 1 subunit theta
MGDATNQVLIFGGELLKKAENLLIMGLHPSEVIKGYELASAKAIAELESMFTCTAFHMLPLSYIHSLSHISFPPIK